MKNKLDLFKKTIYTKSIKIKFLLNKFQYSDNRKKTIKNVLISVITIFLSLVLSIILAVIVYGKTSIFSEIITLIFTSPFSGIQWKQTITLFSIFVIAGLSFSFAQQVNIFNIGISGQLLIGAQIATIISWLIPNTPNVLGQLIVIILSVTVSSLSAMLIGFLKNKFNINEVISSFMFNWIFYFLGTCLVSVMAVKTGNLDASGLNTVLIKDNFALAINSNNNFLKGTWLPLLIIASISIVVSFIIINYSSFGKKIEMIGLSSSASNYAGIKVKKNMLISMCISGAFAGLLGVMIYCAQKGQLETTIISKSIPGEGFAGVAIGLISMNNPISIFPISLLFGAVENSKGVIQQECFVDPYFVDLMFGIIVYGAAIISIMYRFKPWVWIKKIIIDKNVDDAYKNLTNNTKSLQYVTDGIEDYLKQARKYLFLNKKYELEKNNYIKNKNLNKKQIELLENTIIQCNNSIKQKNIDISLPNVKEIKKICQLKQKVNNLKKIIDPNYQLVEIITSLNDYNIKINNLMDLNSYHFYKYMIYSIYFNSYKQISQDYRQQIIQLKLNKIISKLNSYKLPDKTFEKWIKIFKNINEDSKKIINEQKLDNNKYIKWANFLYCSYFKNIKKGYKNFIDMNNENLSKLNVETLNFFETNYNIKINKANEHVENLKNDSQVNKCILIFNEIKKFINGSISYFSYKLNLILFKKESKSWLKKIYFQNSINNLIEAKQKKLDASLKQKNKDIKKGVWKI